MLNMFHYYKLSGAKNSFVAMFLNENPHWKSLPAKEKSECVRTSCQSENVDGFFVLSKTEADPEQKINTKIKSDENLLKNSEWNKNQIEMYDWEFFNSDGSIAEMCGNASRCVGSLVWEKTLNKELKIVKVNSKAGPFLVKKLSKQLFTTEMPKPVQFIKKLSFGFFVDSGVPHLVVKSKPDADLALKLRSDKTEFPQGTNVTFIEFDKDLNHSNSKKINAVTFERGVDDFTQACGTGACAAAFVYLKEYNHVLNDLNVDVQMPGGILQVQFDSLQSAPNLTGEARLEKEFNFEIQMKN